MSRHTTRFSVLCLGILLVLGTISAWSQATTTGSIAGQVTDQSGAVIPGADVALADAETHTTLKTQSNAAGRYIIINVPSGHYSMKVSREGFTSSQVSN